MADIFGAQDVNTIQARLVEYIKQHSKGEETVIEGSFKRDLINATSEEFKNAYFEMDLLRDAAFCSTSWGDYLTAKCSDFGIDRKLAVKAHGHITLTGTANTWIPERSLFQSDSGYKFYTTEESYIGDNGSAIIPIEAAEVGSAYNLQANTITIIPMSIGGVSAATNATPTIDGFDEETDEALYQRYKDYIRLPATSGNVYHYNQWATSIAGVGGCKVTERIQGAGTVGVDIVNANGEKASPDLIAKVRAYIETVRPAGARVIVSTPDTMSINVKVTGAVGSGSPETFKQSLIKYFRLFGFKLTKVSQADIAKQLFSAGYTDYDSILINSTASSANLNGKLPIVGSVSING